MSVPVPTAIQDHHFGPAKRNHKLPDAEAESVNVKFCEGTSKLVMKVEALLAARASSLPPPFGPAGCVLFSALGKMSSCGDLGHSEKAVDVSM
jgi:hypothetical protein